MANDPRVLPLREVSRGIGGPWPAKARAQFGYSWKRRAWIEGRIESSANRFDWRLVMEVESGRCRGLPPKRILISERTGRR